MPKYYVEYKKTFSWQGEVVARDEDDAIHMAERMYDKHNDFYDEEIEVEEVDDDEGD